MPFHYSLGFNPTQDRWGEGKTAPPTSFPPVFSTNMGNSHQNFVTLSFNL